MAVKYALYRLMAAVIVAGFLAFPGLVRAQAAPTEKPEKGIASPQTLPRGFEQGIAQLQEQLKAWESRVPVAAADLAQTQKELDNLQVAVASLKATMVLQRLPLLQVEELLDLYADYETGLKGKLKDLGLEIDELKKGQQEQIESQNALRVQLSIIQARDPAAVTPELQQAFLTYLNLAGDRDLLLTRVLDQLEQRRRLLEQEQELLTGLTPQLKQLEADWKGQLLKRPAAAVPFREQVVQAWKSLAVIPQRGWDWLNGLGASGRLSAFIWSHLAPIFGLLGFILLLGWSTRRFNDLVTRRFRTWRERAADIHLLPLYVLGRALVANLFWLGLFFWTFNLMSSAPAQLILAALVTLWALRLSIQWVQGFFAGQTAGGVLVLDRDVARFYRRFLKLFLVYLGLGFLGLKSAGLLDFPESSRLFVEHYFLIGILVWGFWLLRRPYLVRLLPQLSAPTWLHQPVVGLFLRSLLLFLLAVIILADLLGFQNLSLYLAEAAVWTLLAVVILWFLWLMGETLILHLLHPEAGRATYFFPERAELIQRVFVFSRWTLGIVLGVAVVLWSLNSWGITPHQVAWAFQWMTWGPTLGPVRLTTLNVLGVILAIYLGFFLSRLVRGLMLVRIFPRTALDSGVQYTITTTMHYVILILAGLIALNILGFPLTNLALVAGALGVGIGFGLQNIVNNFLSGLILLFERPIKVGDMLVIDGQWGLVKEIRVRSTIFETFDRYVLIIPNSELVSNKVLNWTHYGAGINRLTLKVGVSYGSDVRQVTQLITEICQANPRVVPVPPPQVYFEAYGDSSLNFNIWVHLRTPSDRIPATHELNSAIFEAFNANGIEIPFPQRDLHVKEWPEALEKKTEG
ncbi:MAG: mechanosensitive ion channel [Proteobacteria bacterium]|nr:mechanosensitive ion channel [Pseudomonadota bacterium]